MTKYLFCFFVFLITTSKIYATDSLQLTIFFHFNKAIITQHEAEKLHFLKNADSNLLVKEVRIIAHTDQIGSTNYNYQLSVKRAFAVKDKLVDIGIDENKILLIIGKGETELLEKSLQTNAIAKNRRAEIYVYFERRVKPTIKTVIEKSEDKDEENDNESLTEKIKDTATKQGDKLVLKNIHFEGGRHIFLQKSYKALNDLVEAMQNISTLVINIEGHICCNEDGSDGFDIDTQTKDLSVRRAKAVYEFLISKGIDEQRMTYQGFGRKYPITQELTEDEKTVNRRVEIRIIRK